MPSVAPCAPPQNVAASGSASEASAFEMRDEIAAQSLLTGTSLARFNEAEQVNEPNIRRSPPPDPARPAKIAARSNALPRAGKNSVTT